MGFFAGAGAGFSKAFNAQREMSHERETDNFRYRMETLIKKKGAYDEEKKKSAKATQLAKDIVEVTKQDPAAVAKFYNMLMSDMSEEKVWEIANKGQFTAVETEHAPEDIQTEGAFETPAPQVEATTPTAPAQAEPDGNGLLQKMFPGMGKGRSRQQRIDDRVTQVSGMTPEEISQYDTGFTPPTMETGNLQYTPDPKKNEINSVMEARIAYDRARVDAAKFPDDESKQAALEQAELTLESAEGAAMFEANAKAGNIVGQESLVKITNPEDGTSTYTRGVLQRNGSYVDKMGKPIPGATGISPEERADFADLKKSLREPAEKVLQAQAAFNSAGRSIAIMNGAIERTNGAVLQSWTSSIAELGQNLTAEAAAAADVLAQAENQTIGEIDGQALEGAVSTLRKINDGYLASGAGNLAHEAALFKAQHLLLTYNLAKMVGQDGARLAEKERQALGVVAKAGNSPQQFRQNMANLMFNQAKAIDDLAAGIKGNPLVSGYIEEWGGVPKVFTPPPTLEFAATDPDVKAVIDVLTPYQGKSGTGQPRMQQKEAPAPQPEQPAEQPAPAEAPAGGKKVIGEQADAQGTVWIILQDANGNITKKRK